MIKNNCAWCGMRINNSEDYYAIHGNACIVCDNRFSRVVRGVGINVTNNKGRQVFKKIRKYTEEEVADMVQQRLIKVNN